jgi:sporulation protein YlmC with PRC-barrel domain
MVVLAAMVLTACGGGATSTNVAPTRLPINSVATEPATEMATETAVATETPGGVPVTGAINPARVSNELDFNVVDQSGNQVGTVDDMVLDLDNTSVAYVIVDTSGAQGSSGNKVAVPWNMLKLQAGMGTGTGAGTATEAPATSAATEAATQAATQPATEAATQAATEAATSAPGTSMTGENVFVLQTDASALSNAPAFDPSTLPQMGQSASGWDAAILSYWQGAGTGTGGAGTGTATEAPATSAATEAPVGTATSAATEAPGVGTATSAPSTGGTGTGTTGTMALQGVALASEVIGTTVTVGASTGTGGAATEAPATEAPATSAPTEAPGVGTATSAPSTGGTGTGTTTGPVSGTIEDLIVNTDSGDILYIVVNAMLTDGEHLIPVPLSMFQWDGTLQSFVLNADAAMLQSAPAFTNGQIPDTTMSGWDSQFQSFWQGNGAGTGGANPTATP